MTTVPNSDTPAPADNSHETLVSDAMSGNYGRPTSGGPPVAGISQGIPPGGDAPAGDIPPNPVVGAIKNVNPDGSISLAYVNEPGAMAGAPVGTGGTQVGPDMGAGATIVVSDSGNMESGLPDADAVGGGTVGNSGPQGAAAAPPLKPPMTSSWP